MLPGIILKLLFHIFDFYKERMILIILLLMILIMFLSQNKYYIEKSAFYFSCIIVNKESDKGQICKVRHGNGIETVMKE